MMKRFLHLSRDRGRSNSDAGESDGSGSRSRSNSTSESLQAKQEQLLDSRLKHLEALRIVKEDYFNPLIQDINRIKIINLVDLHAIIKKKLSDGTTYEDIVSYYSKPDGKRAVNLSTPVFADQRIKEIIQDKATSKDGKIKLLTAYYVHRFSTMGVTEIMQAGYALGMRNDFATQITQALPNDSPDRRAYDQYYQTARSIGNVRQQFTREKKEEVLDDASLMRHNESVERLEDVMLFLGTPEHESACNLSLMLMKMEKRLRSVDENSPLANWVYQKFLYLSENATSFVEQRQLLNDLKTKVASESIGADERAYANALIDEMNNKGHIPVDENNLKALIVINGLRSLLLNYLADKEGVTKSFSDALRGAIHADRESKMKFVRHAILHLNRLAEAVRFGYTTGVAVMTVEGEMPDRLEDVMNVHQLLFLARKKMPSSGLPHEMTETVESLLQMDSKDVSEDWAYVHSAQQGEQAERSISPVLEMGLMHVDDFAADKINSTITMMLTVLSQRGEDVRLMKKHITDNLPTKLYDILKAKHGSAQGAVPAHEFFEEVMLDVNAGAASTTLQTLFYRALFKDIERLVLEALRQSNDTLAIEGFHIMLPIAKSDPMMKADFVTLLDDFLPEIDLDSDDFGMDSSSKTVVKQLRKINKQLESNTPVLLPTSAAYREYALKCDKPDSSSKARVKKRQ